DHHFLRHPDEVFTRGPEPAVVNPANPFILDPHLGCAAYERPLVHDDDRFWDEDLDDGIRRLALDDILKVRERAGLKRAHWAARGRPAGDVGLRTGTSGEVLIAFADGSS